MAGKGNKGKYFDNPDNVKKFLEIYKEYDGNLSSCARILGITFQTIWEYRKLNESFKELLDEAENELIEKRKFNENIYKQNCGINALKKLDTTLEKMNYDDIKKSKSLSSILIFANKSLNGMVEKSSTEVTGSNGKDLEFTLNYIAPALDEVIHNEDE